MKLTTIILFVTLMQVSAATLAQRMTLTQKKVTLDQVFREVRKQTGYNVLLLTSKLNTETTVDANFKNTQLSDVLDQLLGDQFSYTLKEKTIVIQEKAEPSLLDKAKALFAQVTVTGKVVDETGQPLPGVTVKIKSSGGATATDKKGMFTITVPNDQEILVFSFIGFETQEVPLKLLPDNAVITLKATATNLQEVVINKGPYSVRQRENLGDVTRIDGKDIQKQPMSDPILALSGLVPGMFIQQTSGLPGAYAAIQIRGFNSIANGNDPLYIVDGVPFSAVSLSNPALNNSPVGKGNPMGNTVGPNGGNGLSPFNALNPADIESIEVLKDADATAIYGSRGANGVVLITTKKGKAGETKVNINAYSGAGKVAHRIDLLNTQQYLAVRREAYANDGLAIPNINVNPSDANYDINGVWDQSRYTDWQKMLIGGTARFTNLQADVSGGSINTQFLLGAGYSQQGNVFPGDFNDQKSSVHLNISNKSLNGRLSLQFSGNFVHDDNNSPGLNIAPYITLAPDAPSPYDAFGNLNWQLYGGTATFATNPFSFLMRNISSLSDNLITNLNIQYHIAEGLDFKTSLGYNHDEMNQVQLIPSTSVSPTSNLITARSNLTGQTTIASWSLEPQLSYHRVLGAGKLEALVGTSFQQNQYSSELVTASGFTSDALIGNPAAATTINLNDSEYILYRYTAAYGRVAYSWHDKYLINLTGRRDGSSRFGPGKQFGNFGAVGAGWIFSDENFIQNALPWLSFGKLRVSYGISGNDQLADYKWLSTYSAQNTAYENVSILNPTQLTNPYLAWEVVHKLEGGLEFGLFKDRINVQLNYYRNRSSNQLTGLPLPVVTGFSSIQYNLPALVQNKGFEFFVNAKIINNKNFGWTVSANGTLPDNKLLSYPGLAASSQRLTFAIGSPLNVRQGYVTTGINPQTGLYTFQTQNVNGSPSIVDRQVLGSYFQHFYGGLQNSVSYKGLTLDFLIQYVNKQSPSYLNAFNYNPGLAYTGPLANQPTIVLQRWQKAGDQTSIQRYGTGSLTSSAYSNLRSSDAAIVDGSYLRLKNVSLSWQLPQQWVKTLHLENARLFIQGENLFTITNYLGLDPETAGTLNVPPLRMVTAGFQIRL